jgi:hypothetical protein
MTQLHGAVWKRFEEIEVMNSNRLSFALVGLLLVGGVAVTSSAQAQRTVKQPSLDVMTPEGRLAANEDSLKYPPESQPIDATNWDLLHPWSVDAQPALLLTKEALSRFQSLLASGVSPEDAWSELKAGLPASLPTYQFELNKTILAGTHDELRAKLTIIPAPGVGTVPGIHIVHAEVIGSDEFGSPNLGAVPYSCGGTDSGCTLTWRAQSTDKRYWGSLRLQAAVTVDGFPDPFTVSQGFYSSPMTAGKFTGVFQDRIDNGSLVVDAGVSVQKKMVCFVSANLYSVDQATPLQHAERRLLVDPTMKTVSFTFYGKIFRDYADQGTFRLQDLKAACENVPYPAEWFMDSWAHWAELQAFEAKSQTNMEPAKIYFEYNAYSHTTSSYPLSVFSASEWQSPEKTRLLEIYRQEAAAAADPAVAARKQQSQGESGIQ